MESKNSCNAIALLITLFRQSLTPELTPLTESNLKSKLISVSFTLSLSFGSFLIDSSAYSLEIRLSTSSTSLLIAAIFFMLFLTRNPRNTFWIFNANESDCTPPRPDELDRDRHYFRFGCCFFDLLLLQDYIINFHTCVHQWLHLQSPGLTSQKTCWS
ncbi:hypothetical protein CMV_011612 [Castanea mollissima]|uniref:Uncharacterized protein n=1 Tax=Castanea mollissima TaxID=60419 RepID=A0A8J4R4Z1_9ROSI|nr:hypothetical protein CMV_011612 [Castanea mollissima]